tara:strand:- start:2389 stop:3219 length:831 start_codon:yes stop_codon:yes gene_type:complete
MLLFLLFLLFFSYVSSCNVPHKEGHYHMTSVDSNNAMTECMFDLLGQEVQYIEFERYTGREFDNKAWMNFTFMGEPNLEISVGSNHIFVANEFYGMPTVTKLEFSLWLMVRFSQDKISIHFSPPGTANFGHIFSGEHQTDRQLRVVASTTTGMEQVLQQITDKQPEFERPVKRKTIHELERRIRAIEKKLDIDSRTDKRQVKSIYKSVRDLRSEQRDLHIDQRELEKSHFGVATLLEYVETMAWFCFVAILMLYCANCAGGYISWKWYKKQSRWSL